MKQFGKLPDFIENSPELQPWLVHYYEAFLELNTDRPPSMGGVPVIPWSAINAYAKEYEYQGEDYDVLQYMIRCMDNALVEHFQNKGKTQPAPTNGTNPQRTS